MCNLNAIFAVLFGSLAVLTKASPMSFSSVFNRDMSHDSSAVYPQGFYLGSDINSGTTMASLGIDSDFEAAAEVKGTLLNKCGFPVYARLAIAATASNPDRPGQVCAHAGETQEIEVAPGGSFVAPFAATMDQCSHVTRNRGDAKVYQAKYSLDSHDGRMWYDLSSEDGALFQDVDRYMEGIPKQGKCPFVHCAPGQWGKDPVHGCDWPMQPVCPMTGEIVAVLCENYCGLGLWRL